MKRTVSLEDDPIHREIVEMFDELVVYAPDEMPLTDPCERLFGECDAGDMMPSEWFYGRRGTRSGV